MLKAGLLFSLTLLLTAAPAAAQNYSGTCEDLFVPGYTHPEAAGTPIEDLRLIPRSLFMKAQADCEKRGSGFGADAKAKMALLRLRALMGDVKAIPDLQAAADKGLSEASYLIYKLYTAMAPVSPVAPEYKVLPRAVAERELRRAAEDGFPLAIRDLARARRGRDARRGDGPRLQGGAGVARQGAGPVEAQLSPSRSQRGGSRSCSAHHGRFTIDVRGAGKAS